MSPRRGGSSLQEVTMSSLNMSGVCSVFRAGVAVSWRHGGGASAALAALDAGGGAQDYRGTRVFTAAAGAGKKKANAKTC